MRYLTILSVLLPIAAGAALLIWKPEDRAARNRFSLLSVCLGSALVLSTGICSAVCGPAATAFHVAALSEKLVIAFRPDGPSLVFGCIIGVLWPITTVYAFSYMEHEGRENLFFGFFLITYGVVACIAFSAYFFTLYLCY